MSPSVFTQREGHVRTLGGKVVVYKPGKQATAGTNPASALILGFQPSSLGKYERLLFKPRSLWYFVMEVLENSWSPSTICGESGLP